MAKVIPIKLTIDNRQAKEEAKEVKDEVKKIGDEAEKQSKKTEKSFTGSFKKIKDSIISMKGLLVTIATGAFAKMSLDALEAADNIAKTASKLGLTTDRLQEYRFAASQSGIETRTFDMAFQRFGRRIAEVANDQGELLITAKQYGLQVKDNAGRMKDINDIFYQYAELIKNASSDQEALRLAFKAFDSEGAVMVNMLRKGGQGVDYYRKMAQELGIVMKEDVLATSTKVVDKFDQLKKSLSATFTKVVVDNATLIEKAMRGIAWAAEKLGKGASLRGVTDTLNQFDQLKQLGYTNEGLVEFMHRGLFERQKVVDDLLNQIQNDQRFRSPYLERERRTFLAPAPPPPPPTPESPAEKTKRLLKEQEEYAYRLEQINREISYQGEKEQRDRGEVSDAIIGMIQKEREEVEKDRAAWEAMTGANIKATYEWVDKYGEVREKFVSYSQDMSNAFVDFAFTAKLSMKDMIDSILQDFARFAAQRYIFGPLFEAAGAAIFGTGSYQKVQHAGGSYYSGMMRKGMPVFHSGLRGNEYPAILERGEQVKTKEEVRGGGEPKVEVYIMKGNSPQTRTEERRGSDGLRQLMVYVGQDIVNGGPTYQGMIQTFEGLVRRGRRV